MTFNPAVPTGLVKLNQDYLNIQNNFSASNTVFGVDHLPFSNATAQKGYHKSIHMVPTSTIAGNPPNNFPPTAPTTTASYGQYWSAQVNDGYNGDELALWMSGAARKAYITRNFNYSQPDTMTANGIGSLVGGLVVQWGVKASPGGSGSVTFPTPFSTSLFNVQITVSRTGTGGGAGVTVIDSGATFDKTKFSYICSTTNNVNLYWVAFGT